MRIRVRLFARLRELTGEGELERDVTDGATARTVWDGLAREFPALERYAPVVSCAINEEYAKLEARLHDGDEVAFLPPVSGG